MGSTRKFSSRERSHRKVRVAASLAVVLIGLGLLPALAGGYGTVLPEDLTTDHPFGWGADRQYPGGQPEPFVLQYDYDYPVTPKQESCNYLDKVDDPVSAFTFKNANGETRVQLSFPRSPQNRRMIGRDLRDARRENSPTVAAPDFATSERRGCGVDILLLGTSTPSNWREFDDAEYLQSLYYVPGDPGVFNSGDVYGASHQEARQTFNAPTYCSVQGDASNCWFGSITFAQSNASTACPNPQPPPMTPNLIGACFTHNPTPGLSNHLIGTIPYPYVKDWGRHGYAPHANIISGAGTDPEYAGKYFILSVVTGPAGSNQEPGLCLLRTDDVSQPSSWRAWDGDGFDVHPESSENLTGSPDDHLCKPVLAGITIRSLTYNTYLRKYMALGQGSVEGVKGVKYSLSDDLRNWSVPQLLMASPFRSDVDEQCADGVVTNPAPDDGITYPVVLDPNDPAASWPTGTSNPNFERPGAQPDLYFNHKDSILNVPGDPSQGCQLDDGIDSQGRNWEAANLARLPIDFRAQRQASLEDSSLVDKDSGFDSISHQGAPPNSIFFQTGPGAFIGGDGYGEGSQKFAEAVVYGSLTNKESYGTVDTKWGKDGTRDDVWYGSALYLPANFTSTNVDVDILRWQSTSGGDHGGIGFRAADDKFRLVKGTGSSSSQLGIPFDLPLDRWVWVEVHQRFGQSSGDAPQSEMYIDGHLVTSSVAPNRSSGDVIDRLNVGFVAPDPNATVTSWMLIDRVSVLAGQRGAFGAPATPVGLRATGGSGAIAWNAVPGVTGYRIYINNDVQTDGTWLLSDDVAAGSTSATLDICGNTLVRIAAYTSTGGITKESVVSSAPLVTGTSC